MSFGPSRPRGGSADRLTGTLVTSALVIGAFLTGALMVAAGCGRDTPRPTGSAPPLRVSVRTVVPPVVPIRITGHDLQWRIQYPGPDGILATDDDQWGEQDLHLPAHAQIQLELCSDDFAYTLFLPHLDLMEVAVPNAPYLVEFQTDDPGTFELLGSQMCGYIHPLLIGKVKVGS